MRILHVASEAAPFAQTGGLAQVVGSLPKALSSLGHEIAVFIPFYRCVRHADASPRDTGIRLAVGGRDGTEEGEVWESVLPDGGVPIYFIGRPRHFDREGLYGTPRGDYPDNCERFAFFCKAFLAAIRELGLRPDVLHLHDWQTALVAPYVRLAEGGVTSVDASTLLTIHNLAYQGRFPPDCMASTGLDRKHFNLNELEFFGDVNLLKGGIVFADLITTVSKRYAREIQEPELGCRLDGILRARRDDLHGVVNGLDESWDPEHDPHIAAGYSVSDLSGKKECGRALRRELGLPDTDRPLVAMISRLDEQKGLDLVARSLPDLMASGVQFVLLGVGAEKYHDLFRSLAKEYPEQVSVQLRFDGALSHRIQAGADMLLVPSRFEPCGLVQLCGLRYGTVPVVHATGGLADTVRDASDSRPADERATGFHFRSYTKEALLEAVHRSIALFRRPAAWRRLMVDGMKNDWSWRASALKYVELYALATSRRREREAP